MLNRRTCNDDEVNEILNLIKNNKIDNLKFTYYDYIGFIYCEIKTMVLQFQERIGNNICYFSLIINNDSYDIVNPKGEFRSELVKILNIAKEEISFGKSLKDKIEIELNKLK